MESRKIKIFESFALISVVMPYYGPTHQAFIILSSLWARSRWKLDQYYDAFRRLMIRNAREVLIYDKQKNLWSLPSDLFRLRPIIESKEEAQVFIDFAQRIISKQGCYFNNHFMHELVNIDDVIYRWDPCWLEQYIDELKSIQVINDLFYETKDGKVSLLDKIIIDVHSFMVSKNYRKMYKVFKRIKYEWYFRSKSIYNELELIKNKDMKINDVKFEINCIEDQSILIDPKYFMNKWKHINVNI